MLLPPGKDKGTLSGLVIHLQGWAAQAVYAGGHFFCSAYLAPVEGAQEVIQEIAATVFSLPSGVRWCLGGDFNLLPSQNELLEALSGLGAQLSTPKCPTRWTGKRCIDYFFGTLPMTEATVLSYKLSDHKVVSVDIDTSLHRCEHFVQSPAPVLPEPPPELREKFLEAVQQEWANCPKAFRDIDDLDERWHTLSAALFQTLAIIRHTRELVPRRTSSRARACSERASLVWLGSFARNNAIVNQLERLLHSNREL